MYDVKISGFTRSSIYIYDISRLRVEQPAISPYPELEWYSQSPPILAL
jgi:hypothetical protein